MPKWWKHGVMGLEPKVPGSITSVSLENKWKQQTTPISMTSMR